MADGVGHDLPTGRATQRNIASLGPERKGGESECMPWFEREVQIDPRRGAACALCCFFVRRVVRAARQPSATAAEPASAATAPVKDEAGAWAERPKENTP